LKKNSPFRKEFRDLIRSARWSQAETARQLDITPGAVSQICTGRTQPRAATLNLLRLMVRRGRRPRRTPEIAQLRPMEAEFLNALRNLPQAQQENLLKSLHELLMVLMGRK